MPSRCRTQRDAEHYSNSMRDAHSGGIERVVSDERPRVSPACDPTQALSIQMTLAGLCIPPQAQSYDTL